MPICTCWASIILMLCTCFCYLKLVLFMKVVKQGELNWSIHRERLLHGQKFVFHWSISSGFTCTGHHGSNYSRGILSFLTAIKAQVQSEVLHHSTFSRLCVTISTMIHCRVLHFPLDNSDSRYLSII